MDKAMRRLDKVLGRAISKLVFFFKERRLIASNDPLICRRLIISWRCQQAAPFLFRTMTKMMNIDADWESVLWVALICIGFSLALWIVQAAIELIVAVL